jgi:hypothetical protein
VLGTHNVRILVPVVNDMMPFAGQHPAYLDDFGREGASRVPRRGDSVGH